MKAFKCDRCHEYVDIKNIVVPILETRFPGIGSMCDRYDSTEEIELCYTCANAFKQWVRPPREIPGPAPMLPTYHEILDRLCKEFAIPGSPSLSEAIDAIREQVGCPHHKCRCIPEE